MNFQLLSFRRKRRRRRDLSLRLISMVKKAILKIIKFYQMFISPGMGYHCRFYPSCSKYTAETIKKHGTLEGIKRGLWRIIRCHPFNKGGIDLP